MFMYRHVKKTIQKSIRLTDNAFDYISKFPGNGFQESFDNMIIYFQHHESEKKNQLEMLEKEIVQKNKELATRQEFLNDTLDIVDLCEEFTYAATILRKEVNSLIHTMEEDKPPDIPFGENSI